MPSGDLPTDLDLSKTGLFRTGPSLHTVPDCLTQASWYALHGAE